MTILLMEMLAGVSDWRGSALAASQQSASRLGGASTSAQSTTPPAPASQLDLTRYVDPFVGTGIGGQSWGIGAAGGDTFPGATLPRAPFGHLPGQDTT